jgi:aspartate-semialdehyde dehydrogenase
VALLNFREVEKDIFPHQIAFNCIPHIGVFSDDGTAGEEQMIVDETGKILEDASIRITATAVRVPVFRCHSASVNIETEKKISPNELRAVLAATPGVIVYDDPKRDLYPLAIDMAGKDETYVGRIRTDESIPHGINLWLASDNIRRGAALNAVQIAQLLIK